MDSKPIPKFSSDSLTPDENVKEKPKKAAAVPVAKNRLTMGEDYEDENPRKPFGSTNLPTFDELMNSQDKPRKPIDIDKDYD